MARLQDGKKSPRSKKNRKLGRNKTKCERYRARVGKPAGRGKPSNKAGKKSTPGS